MTEAFRQWHLTGPRTVELRRPDVPEPSGAELLLEVVAATTCGTDVKVYERGGHARMLTPPCPFGHEMTGRVIAIGPEQHEWAVGDQVLVANSASCGECEPCQRHRENLCTRLVYLNGAFGERLLVPGRFAARSTYRLPPGLDPHVACLSEPLACAVHCLERLTTMAGTRDGTIEGRVLVIGAGPLGLLLVDLFADAGGIVSAVDPHPDRLDVARALGAEAVEVADSGGDTAPALAASPFDFVIEATGTGAAWRRAMASVAPGGHVAFFGGCPAGTTVPLDTHLVHYSEVSLHGIYHHRPSTFRRAVELLAAGTVEGARLLTTSMPLGELPQALELMRARRALKVALRIRD